MIVRGVANLPHGTGKKIRVCVFAEGEQADEARAAGADVVGGDELIAEIKSMGVGAIDFDKAIAHPAIMPKLSAIARVLGPRGMMPNPKVGTLTANITEAVAAMRLGRVEFRAEKGAIVHACVGKVDFEDAQLEENVAAFMARKHTRTHTRTRTPRSYIYHSRTTCRPYLDAVFLKRALRDLIDCIGRRPSLTSVIMDMRPKGIKGAPSATNYLKARSFHPLVRSLAQLKGARLSEVHRRGLNATV